MISSVLIRFAAAAACCLAWAHIPGPHQRNAFAAEPGSSSLTKVKAVRAAKKWFSDTIHVTGVLVPRQEAIVLLDEGSKVIEVLAKEGDRVTAGQPLARASRVSPDGQPAAAGPASAKPASGTYTVSAPAAGLVTHSTASAGTGPSARGEPLFRIMINGEVELAANVPSIHVPRLAAGQTARASLEDGTSLRGEVRLAPAQVDQTTQLGQARVSVPQDKALRPGMFASAAVDASQSYGIAVPREAVSYQSEGTSVQIVRDGKIETRKVRAGLSSDTAVEISQGLNEGDIVVADSGTSLYDGDPAEPDLPEELDN
ncbi:MAG: efflux RND transporter periplasmic adaptor subunit [Beijerinckiaceae bacterium]|nr:efflux RND transporter periplasmic adaptor subunit [Beijerinckiaceae bacterium]